MTMNSDFDNQAVGTQVGVGPYYDTSATPTQATLDTQVMMDSPEAKSRSPLVASLRRFMRDKRAMISLALIVIIVGISFIGPLIYMHIGPTIIGGPSLQDQIGPQIYHDPTHQELTKLNQPPSAAYPLGTDQLGRDILARLMAGVQVSIVITAVVVIFDVVLGLVIGTLAGFFGGWMDTFLARFTDLMFAFPILLFAILAAATLGPAFIDRFGPSGRLLLVALALGFTIWPQMARYVRGQTLSLKGQQDVVGIITAEATLSLIGLGVQAPGSSLGLMISDASGQIYIQWTEVLWPVLVLAALVLCFSFVGDGVGDAFNPRTKD